VAYWQQFAANLVWKRTHSQLVAFGSGRQIAQGGLPMSNFPLQNKLEPMVTFPGDKKHRPGALVP